MATSEVLGVISTSRGDLGEPPTSRGLYKLDSCSFDLGIAQGHAVRMLLLFRLLMVLRLRCRNRFRGALVGWEDSNLRMAESKIASSL